MARPVAPPPIWADPRAFAARLRNELHALLVALARKDRAAAAEALAPGASGPPAQPRGGAGALLGRARPHRRHARRPQAAQHLHHARLAPRRWEAVQRMVDEAGEVDWAIHCEVDLSGEYDREAPLIRLVRVERT